MGAFADTFRTFRTPLLCMFLLLIPGIGLWLMLIAWSVWAMRNWHRFERWVDENWGDGRTCGRGEPGRVARTYKQDELDSGLAEDLR